MEEWNVILPIIVATAGAVAYFHVQIDSLKKELLKAIEDSQKETFSKFLEEKQELEKEHNELARSHKNLFSRYIKRGEKIKTTFQRFKDRYVRMTTEIEDLYRRNYDLRCDVDDIYKQAKLQKRERNIGNYESFRESTVKPNFDTLNEISKLDVPEMGEVNIAIPQGDDTDLFA
jgi:SMC interacting uncharacterized protein involved in chromosome segregation